MATSKNQTPQEEWIEISIEIDQHLQDALANFLIELGSSGVVVDEEISDPLYGKVTPGSKDRRRVCSYLKKDGHYQHRTQSLDRYLKSLTELHSLKFPPRLKLTVTHEDDWNKKWQKYFTTARVGTHIIIKPSWELFLPNEGDVIIEMDPGMAFGTGTHATTRMCLEAIENLIHSNAKSFHSMLDVGIGSGILSIAAAKLGVEKLVGIDIDPIALRYAKQNIEKNHVADKIELQELALNRVEGKFDLVVANILSEVILKLRKELYKHLDKNGILILSGIMDENESKIKKKFVSKNLPLAECYHDTDWICLVLQKQL